MSLAVAAKVAAAPDGLDASTTTSATGAMDGAVVSRTVTLNVLLAELPAASVAVAVTCVVPSAKVLPEAGLKLTSAGPLTESAAVAAKVTAAPFGPVASALMSAGASMDGPVVSRTTTLNVPVEVLPALSVAVA